VERPRHVDGIKPYHRDYLFIPFHLVDAPFAGVKACASHFFVQVLLTRRGPGYNAREGIYIFLFFWQVFTTRYAQDTKNTKLCALRAFVFNLVAAMPR